MAKKDECFIRVYSQSSGDGLTPLLKSDGTPIVTPISTPDK